MDKIHVDDEKWFWISKVDKKYLLVDGEEELPYRHVRHKNYMEKVMFFSAQARPQWDPTTHSMWDGKLGSESGSLQKEAVAEGLLELWSGRVVAWATKSVRRDGM
jgi:hypothetical protein